MEGKESPERANSSSPSTSQTASGAFTHFQPYARSKGPILGLGTLFAVSAIIPSTVVHPNVYFPPYLHRVGFSLVFGGAAYVLGAGDARNGSGIATAWSLTYLFLHLRQSLKPPFYPITLAMTAGTAACAALYGTEYFMYQT
ncbi:uncharacterized protein BJ212DRAFT_1387286 [Suillus subaureus]|uniref:Uncharacterized protein n=1 Tax=Suillus subaureus TaxID=48587 RepID=A0A9P7J834_9AGAM|nr:uncharacterized protein BJ212DRAFT_1387286 [Suillus subaureus]KAG1807263.1 hypothetical protein BJ212DRAFT_1387286 [Suillus subaureus]